MPFILADASELPKFWFSPVFWPLGFGIIAYIWFARNVNRKREGLPEQVPFLWAVPLLIGTVLAVMEYFRLKDPVLHDLWNVSTRGHIMLRVGFLLDPFIAGIIAFQKYVLLPKKDFQE